MATRPKNNLGKMPCPECGEPVAVRESRETGTLSFQCQDADCEASGYAQAHTGVYRRWKAKITPPKGATQAAPQEPAPAPAPEPKAPPKPAKQAPPAPQAQEPKGLKQWW